MEHRMEERQAIRRLKIGDISGLEALVEAYQVRAVHTATLITRDPGLAQDVAQSAFMHVYERIDQFDSDRPFAPWFFRIVSNLALNALRRGSRTISLEQSDVEALPAGLPVPPDLVEA